MGLSDRCAGGVRTPPQNPIFFFDGRSRTPRTRAEIVERVAWLVRRVLDRDGERGASTVVAQRCEHTGATHENTECAGAHREPTHSPSCRGLW